MRFFDFLFPPRVDERTLRTVSADEFLAFLSPRLVPYTHPGTAALLPFSALAVRAAVHEAKYHGSEYAFRLLGLALTEYLREADEGSARKILVPVPLSGARQSTRGFNQVEEVARRALENLSAADSYVLDATLLMRSRDTHSQVSLPRPLREENMRDAFRAARPADPACTYILLDDVLTTGATLQAAIDALAGAGATHVMPVALAH